MNGGIGHRSSSRTSRGFLPWDHFLNKKKAPCSDEHKKNPNFTKPNYTRGQYGILTEDEKFKVNTKHKCTEELALALPMNRKLARHFAQDACDNAMKKLSQLFKGTSNGEFDIETTLQEIAAADEQDLQKKNLNTGLRGIKAKRDDKKKEEEEKSVKENSVDRGVKAAKNK